MPCELTILMPCLNEAETLGTCVTKARSFLERTDINGEILVADNGSTDGSQSLAVQSGARVVSVEQKGYGAALMGGIKAADGVYVIMADADNSYDFSKLDGFIEQLRKGSGLVMGNRFRGGILPGAMPWLHRYIGNPILSGLGRLFFGNPCGDFHCGLRGFNRQAVLDLDLHTTGMEFASEMVAKAALRGVSISEVPVTLAPDGRSRKPHLRSWHDGWRHLRFLLIYSPRWLFLYPGMAMILLGLALMVWLIPGSKNLLGTTLDIHTMLFGAGFTLLGLQAVQFAVFTKIFGINMRFLPLDAGFERVLRMMTLERLLLTGVLITLIGAGGSSYALFEWSKSGFGPQDPSQLMRLVVPSVTSMLLGIQVILGGFFMSVLRIPHSPASSELDD